MGVNVDESVIADAINVTDMETVLKFWEVFDDGLHTPTCIHVLRLLLSSATNIRLDAMQSDLIYARNPIIDALNQPNSKEIIQLLIGSGFDVNYQDKRGNSLAHAITKSDYEAIELMVANGLNVNTMGWREQYIGNELND